MTRPDQAAGQPPEPAADSAAWPRAADASTAKTHAARAMTKLGARDRAQLVVFVYQAGLVRPGWAD
jgi:hypothetical protein